MPMIPLAVPAEVLTAEGSAAPGGVHALCSGGRGTG
jgi:hypothetical protein